MYCRKSPVGSALRTRAFTLIEVTLAVGIASIALVALMGMLPQGIRTLKRAGDQAIEARIHQQIVSEISLTNWDKRFEYNSEKHRIRFYDDQGIDITSATLSDPVRFPRTYVARIIVPRSKTSERPGDDSGGYGQAPTALPVRLGSSEYSSFDSTKKDHDEVQLIIVEILSSYIDEDSTSASSWDQHFDNKQNWTNIHTYQARITRLIDREMAEGGS